MTDVYARVQQCQAANLLAWELGNALDHLSHALELLMDGNFHDAHWELWTIGATKEVPWEQQPLFVEAAE